MWASPWTRHHGDAVMASFATAVNTSNSLRASRTASGTWAPIGPSKFSRIVDSPRTSVSAGNQGANHLVSAWAGFIHVAACSLANCSRLWAVWSGPYSLSVSRNSAPSTTTSAVTMTQFRARSSMSA